MDIHHLYAHAAHPSTAIDEMWVEVARPVPNRIALRFIAAGRAGEILLPDPALPERTDELWRTTCFEAFIKPVGGSSYRELNLSPSARWAAYAFDDYRAGMRDAALLAEPIISLSVETKRLVLDAEFELDLPAMPHALALSAVIETKEGEKSFWALTHPLGEPDFHNAACFAVDLTPPDKA